MVFDQLQDPNDLTATRDTTGYRPNYEVINDNQATVSPAPPGILNVLMQNNALLPASNKQRNVATTALPVLSLSATKTSVRFQGRAFTLIQFSFVVDPGDPNFQGVVIWVNGYRGKGTAVNPAWQFLGSGPVAPVVVLAEDTGETIICKAQTFDITGAYSDFVSSPSISVVLDAANSFEVLGALNLPAATNANLWFTGLSTTVIGRMYVGDGSGKQVNFAKRTGSTDTDLFQFFDSGNLTISGIITVSGSGTSSFGGVIKLSEVAAPSGSAGYDFIWGDSTAHRLKMNNNNAGADTVVGAATTDTFTNKTFDTAGTGNVLKINTHQITGVTGPGTSANVVVADTASGASGTTRFLREDETWQTPFSLLLFDWR